MNPSSNQEFQYTYSAKEQTELKQIRNKYLAKATSPSLSKLEQVRQLDAHVGKRATVAALILGVLGALTMGFGMSLIMTELGSLLRLSDIWGMAIGISLGLLGIMGVVLAYPVYQTVLEKERRKAAPEILRLTEELINDGN